MRHEQVKKAFLDWTEGRLQDTRRAEIETHLESCEGCRRYYRQMAELLAPADPALLPQLTADPFLPTRIKALAASPEKRLGKAGNFRWVWTTAMFLLAMYFGVFLGKGLAEEQRSSSTTELLSEFSEVYYPQTLADNWATIFETENGETK
ncbi:MAG: zf-HC2 domain-containing protein [Calditrichaeota bacterium]|nr:zf-HC2 domain-containing protein [Calditrichota bacterium]